MAQSSNPPTPHHHTIWRTLAVWVLVSLGLLSATGYFMVRWTEREVLNTDAWVQLVAPLPKDDTVASALSLYTVDQLVTTTDLQNKIQEALPDKASFLSAPLTEQLQARLTKRTKQFIQSDQFTAVWTQANIRASQRLLTTARGVEVAKPRENARFNIDLSALRSTVADILDKRGIVRPTRQNSAVQVNVGLKASAEKVHSYIRLIDFLYATLGMFALVCLVGAVVLAQHRRKVVMVISLGILILGLLELIGVKSLRPYVLEQVANASYRPAVAVVYDSLLKSYRSMALNAFWLGAIGFLLSWLLSERFLEKNRYTLQWLRDAKSSSAWFWWNHMREKVRLYRYRLWGGAVVLGLIILAFFVELSNVAVIRGVLWIVLLVEVINLVAARPRESPMK